MTILPAASTIERLCADALVAAERCIETRIAERLDFSVREQLDGLLTEMVDGNISRFIWLRQFEVGSNSASANRLLDRLEFLRGLEVDPQILLGVPPHRIARLRRQGERYFTDGLRDISSDRRWAILAVCVVEWEAAIADAIIETHDRIVGKTWREAKRLHDERIAGSKAAVTDTLRAFTALGASLLEARDDGVPLDNVLARSAEWHQRTAGCRRDATHQYIGRRAVGSRRTRVSSFSPICAADVAMPEAQGCVGGGAIDCSRESHRRNTCADINRYIIPAAEFEMASPSPSARPRRWSFMGGRGAVSSSRCFPVWRHMAGSFPPLRRSQAGACSDDLGAGECQDGCSSRSSSLAG